MAELTVHDSGVGVDTEALPYLFSRQRPQDPSKHSARAKYGRGLGLIRDIIDLHGLLPKGVKLTRVKDKSLSEMLASNEIDCALIARPPDCFRPTAGAAVPTSWPGWQASWPVRRAAPFPTSARTRAPRAWARTGRFPRGAGAGQRPNRRGCYGS